MSTTHEDFSGEHEIQGPSNRSFGLVFAAFFALIAVLPYLRGRHPSRVWPLITSAAFLIATIVYAPLLGPLNRAWMQFARVLSKITTPIFVGLIFFVAFTPVALVLRWMGKDLLRARLDPSARTYWIHRQPPGPDGESMVNQF